MLESANLGSEAWRRPTSEAGSLPPLGAEARPSHETDIKRGVVLEAPGLFKAHPRSGWKPGRFRLTRQRLCFMQKPRIAWEVPVAQIVRVRPERLHTIVRKQETIRLVHRDKSGNRVSSVWLLPQDVGIWLRRLAALCFHDPAEACAIVLPHLSREGAAVLQYLCARWHASLEEVALHAGVQNPEEVLRLVHREVNPVALRTIGLPLLASEPGRERGSHATWAISFEWPDEEEDFAEEPHGFACDVFDEAEGFCVVADLPGVGEGDLAVEALDGRVHISAAAGSRVYRKEVPLPEDVDPESVRSSLHNHVLELRFGKRGGCAEKGRASESRVSGSLSF